MSIYSQGVNTTITTTASPALDVKAASANAPKVMEIALSLAAATASTYGIGRPGNDGSVAQTSPVLFQAENPGDPAANTGSAVAWGTAPTVPTVQLRRITLPATIGAGVIWTWPRGLTLPATKGFVLWNLAANSANTNFWCIIDE